MRHGRNPSEKPDKKNDDYHDLREKHRHEHEQRSDSTQIDEERKNRGPKA